MPIEDKPNEIFARIRDPSDFEEIYGYTDIDEKQGIRAIYGRLKTGKNAIQAYRFNKAHGWTVDKARKWLKDHDIATLMKTGEFKLGPEHDKFEAQLFKGLGPEFAPILHDQHDFLPGGPIRLYDVVDRFKNEPVEGGSWLGIGGNILRDNVSIGGIEFLTWGRPSPILEAVAREAVRPAQQGRVQFRHLDRGPVEPVLPLMEMVAVPSQQTIIRPGPASEVDLTGRPPWRPWRIQAKVLYMAADMPGFLPADVRPVPLGMRVLIKVGEDAVQVTDDAGNMYPEIVNLVNKVLHRMFPNDTVIHGWAIPVDLSGYNLVLDDLYRLEGENIYTKPRCERSKALSEALGKSKAGLALAGPAPLIVKNQEELEKALAQYPVALFTPHSDVLTGNATMSSFMVTGGPAFAARVLSVRCIKENPGENFAYLVALDTRRGLVPLGETAPTKIIARPGERITLRCAGADCHTDPSNDALWMEARNLEVLGFGDILGVGPDQAVDELLWGEGIHSRMAYPHGAVLRARVGTHGNEWLDHLAEARQRQFWEEALTERVDADRLRLGGVELQAAAPDRGRYLVHVHRPQDGSIPTHTDLRLEAGGKTESWALFNGGGPCGCDVGAEEKLCCPASLKQGQAGGWVGPAPAAMSDAYEETGGGTFVRGISTPTMREFFLSVESAFMDGRAKKRLIFVYEKTGWFLKHIPGDQPLLLSTRFKDDDLPLPPSGTPWLPDDVADRVPEALKYWRLQDDGARRTTLVALRQSIRKKEVRLFSHRERVRVVMAVESIELGSGKAETLMAYNYSLQEQVWPAGKRWILNLDVEGQSLSLVTDTDPKFEDIPVRLITPMPADFLRTGKLSGAHPWAPAQNIASDISVLDRGKVIILQQSAKAFKFNFRGKTFRGVYEIDLSVSKPCLHRDGKSITLKDEDLVPLRFKAVALTEGVWNGRKYPEDEISKMKWEPYQGDDKVYFLADHSKSAFDKLGTVDKTFFDPKHAWRGKVKGAMCAEVTCNEPAMARALVDGDVTGVSCGLDLDEEDGDPPIARDLVGHELSAVSIPACSDCRVEEFMDK